MTFKLPPLPYEMDALEPHISKETLEYHYGKHHQAYINNLNKLVEGTEFANSTLEQIIMHAEGGIFNNAAQVWNHTFYWHSLSPNGGEEATGEIAKLIKEQFGSFDHFKQAFTQSATTLFGSGWTWLVKNHNSGTLAIVNTSNAENPMKNGDIPLLTCDVWEHAYYIDVRNARPKYLENFWNIINWDFANHELAKKR